MGCENCGAVQDATKRIQKDKRTHELKKLLIVCGAVVLVVACICGTILGMYTVKTQQETIIEQQYALNMQYAGLLDLMSGAEITSEYVDTGDGDNGTAFIGDGNTVAGGDLNG